MYHRKHKTLLKYKSSRCKLHIFYAVLNAILGKKFTVSDSFVKTLTHGLCETVDSNGRVLLRWRGAFPSRASSAGIRYTIISFRRDETRGRRTRALKVHFYFHCPRGFYPPVVVALLTQAVTSLCERHEVRSVSHLHKYIEAAFKLVFRVLERWTSAIPGCNFLKF